MANLQYTADLLADALFRAGEPNDGNSDFTDQALTYLNLVYMQICRGGAELAPSINEDWAWLHKSRPGALILQPALTGLCTVTQGSVEVTLSPAQPTSLIGYYFKVQGHPDVFRVVTNLTTTTLELDYAYTGSNASGVAYTAFQLEYDLELDVMRITSPMRCYVASTPGGSWWRYRIDRVAPDILDLWDAVSGNTGIPDVFAEVGPVNAGYKRVRFNRYLSATSTEFVRIEYEYLYRPTPLTAPGTSEEPVLPLEWRHLLSDYVLAYLHGVKNDDRSGPAAQMAQAGLVGMARENRYQMSTASHQQFRIKSRSSGGRSLLRTESGSIIG